MTLPLPLLPSSTSLISENNTTATLYIFPFCFTYSENLHALLQRSLNYPCWGDQTMQMYGNYDGIHPYIVDVIVYFLWLVSYMMMTPGTPYSFLPSKPPKTRFDPLFFGPNTPRLLPPSFGIPASGHGSLIICPGGNYQCLAAIDLPGSLKRS